MDVVTILVSSMKDIIDRVKIKINGSLIDCQVRTFESAVDFFFFDIEIHDQKQKMIQHCTKTILSCHV